MAKKLSLKGLLSKIMQEDIAGIVAPIAINAVAKTAVAAVSGTEKRDAAVKAILRNAKKELLGCYDADTIKGALTKRAANLAVELVVSEIAN